MPDLSQLERQLQALPPRPMTDAGRESCSDLIQKLAREADSVGKNVITFPVWSRWAAAAAVLLVSVGVFALHDPTVVSEDLAHEEVQSEPVTASPVASSDKPRVQIPVRNVRERIYREATVEDAASGVVMTVIDPVDSDLPARGSSF